MVGDSVCAHQCADGSMALRPNNANKKSSLASTRLVMKDRDRPRTVTAGDNATNAEMRDATRG